MGKEIRETLKIENFLSIKEATWELADFNVLAGEMATGKSLCIKLLKFFEDIVPELLTSSYTSFIRNLDIDNLYRGLNVKFFDNIFYFKRSDYKKFGQFKVIYTFLSSNSKHFNMTVSGTNDTNAKFECHYLEELLKEWKQVFEEDVYLKPESASVGKFSQVKKIFYNKILKDFDNCFPVRAIFIPASRAALMSSSSHIDEYLSDYNYFLSFLPRYDSRNLHIDKIDKILKADFMYDGNEYFLNSKDGRRIKLRKGSSGQQEIATILLLLTTLGNFRFAYSIAQSIIIEGLSTHIFPADQKEMIELIVDVYRELKKKSKHSTVRFFITVNSLIILDCLNNMIKKGMLLEKYKKYLKKIVEINNLVLIPELNHGEVSVNFIDQEGKMKSLLNKRKNQLIKTDDITSVIDVIKSDANKLDSYMG
jgi:hypothetical protein